MDIYKYDQFERYKLGDTLSYPCDDFMFRRIVEITPEVGRAILTTHPDGKHVHNKVALMIRIDQYDMRVQAVYQHDDRWWIIEREF